MKKKVKKKNNQKPGNTCMDEDSGQLELLYIF